ncbi:hypothetical protein LIER_37745 [Lithospermum erythrorhizon]|uniref:Uncharacterized protein n=1 Tax=Lithospermum erythrorhizon TaxID=34254 RepID=A0AAV3PU26_LITER
MTFDEDDSGKKKGLARKVSTEEGDEDNLVETMNIQPDNPTVDHTLTPDDSDEEDLTQEELFENYKVIDQESNVEKEDTDEEDDTTGGDMRTGHVESIVVDNILPEPAART